MPHAFDPKSDNIAVPQLVHLHAQLGAKLLANRKERVKLAADMKHVEAVIRIFDPSYDTRRIAVKRRNKPNPWLKKGTVFRNALEVLRAAEKPLTATEIAKGILVRKAIANPSGKPVKDTINAMYGSLRRHNGKSVMKVGEGQPARWILRP